MPFPPIFILAWVFSLAFTLLIGVGVLTYVRRTWQQIRSEEDGSAQERLLDGIDQIQTQLYMMGERLDRLERRLEGGDEGGEPRLSPANDT